MARNRQTKELNAAVLAMCITLGALIGVAAAAESEQSKTSGGFTVYLGIIPAEMVKGPEPHSAERPMHGRTPRGPHEYHVVAAVFDTANSARVSDAAVTAQVSGLGLSGPSKKLEPMQIAGTVTYGAFFNLPGRDLYRVRLNVARPGVARPVTFEFKYNHR